MAISIEEALGLFGRVYSGEAIIIGTAAGFINQVFHIRNGGKDLILRARFNEEGFQYEKGAFKEVVAAKLFERAGYQKSTHFDSELALIWGDTVRTGSAVISEFPLGADVLYYDFTGGVYPGPWAIFQWVGDTVGASFGTAHAKELGRTVARLHEIRFAGAYTALHSLDGGGENIVSAWSCEIIRRNHDTATRISSEWMLRSKLESLAARCSNIQPHYVLCHNDLHCFNVTILDNRLHIVDWDNAQIAPKELDFVKLAHWSKIGEDGTFVTDAGIFSAFCKGYGVAESEIRASPFFVLAEILWLYRVFDFTLNLPSGAVRSPFWQASRYEGLLLQKLNSI